MGVAGDLWSWILDYLLNRTQTTVVNGSNSEPMTVQSGISQGSVLSSILFFLFCNDLPDIANDDDDIEIEIYADDATIFVTGATIDIVTTRLNEILCKFSLWCSLKFSYTSS